MVKYGFGADPAPQSGSQPQPQQHSFAAAASSSEDFRSKGFDHLVDGVLGA